MSIELLRIVAMLLIAFQHFPKIAQFYNHGHGFWQRLPLAEAASFITELGGGDCLFFGISVWFLCEETPSLKRSLGRAWQLEKQLLYYSFILFAIDLCLMKIGILNLSAKRLVIIAARTLFPVTLEHWWYPSAYVMFLIIFPPLTVGLYKLRQRYHFWLALALILFWGWIPNFAPSIARGMSYSIFLFVFQYVLLSYVKWYHPDVLKQKRVAYYLIAFGGVVGFISQALGQMYYVKKGRNVAFDEWLNCPACVIPMMIALGLLILANCSKNASILPLTN
ncbi:hypothetical protein PT279_01785 [Bifidobacterium sp. ESL0784]|uniref:acyltransferase family protein n=1 Tax=Bifidobacterium sp. ESL0784 TaxID=2983231 RepID=UPI0023F85064|nr:acyltransferase family protein [Bifidobacterium sp. ESL0784]MDF7640328.1 hypothetical protein [Bifidobacterium sp. ESL0784]